MPGFTTAEVAEILELCRTGAYDLLVDISGMGGAPIWGPDEDGRWCINIDEKRIAEKFKAE